MGIYFDGFNFLHGLLAKEWGRYRWLDYRALAERLIAAPQTGVGHLVDVKLFTARPTHDPEALVHQDLYLHALEVRAGLTIVHGRFQSIRVKCVACGMWYRRPQEKQTDVNFATHLVADAYEDSIDAAFVISADADLAPAIQLLRTRLGKRVFLIDPPGRHSRELAAASDGHAFIPRSWINQAQLPDPVVYVTRRGNVRRLHRPSDWGDPKA